MLIDMLGFGLILPLLPIYITHYGGAPWVGGALLASFSVMQFIFAPIWGKLSDRVGRRPLILLSLCGSGLSYLFFGIAPNLAALFVARVAAGILTAASMPTIQAYIADVTPPEKRAGGMAMIGAAFGLGFAFGPVIGGFMSRFSVFGLPPLATPALFAAGLALVNFCSALFLLPESHTDRKPSQASEKGLSDTFPALARAIKSPTFGPQLVVFAFTTFAFTAVESSFSWLSILRFHDLLKERALQTWQGYAHLSFAQLPPEFQKAFPANVNWNSFSGSAFAELPKSVQQLMVEQASTHVTSSIFAIVGITILFVQGAVMGGLARKIGEARLVKFGTLLLTITLVGIALTPSLSFLYFLSAMIALGNGILSPSLSSLITQEAGPQDRGMISGAQHGLGSMSRVIAPPINNYLVGMSFVPLGSIPFFASSVLMGTAFFLSLRLRSAPRKAMSPPS